MSYFERRTREDGTTFTTMIDNVPEWVHDAVMEAHGDELPNDWRYETCETIFGAFEDDYDSDDEDARYDLAQSLVDIYNADLFRWLAGHSTRYAYCDEALDDGLDMKSIVDLVMAGQFRCIEHMVSTIGDAIVDNRVEEDA
jgi:hypothetical protein